MNYFLSKPENFSFRNTIYSHGWCGLAPFELNEETWELEYVFPRDDGGKPVAATISETPKKIKIKVPGRKIAKAATEKILSDVNHILRIDEGFAGFYRVVEKEESLNWVARSGTGRLLRSPSVYEDLVKTICTTNCSWALTQSMVSRMVENLGVAARGGKKAFPTPSAMANVDVEFFRDEIRAGYRSPYFVELAEAVAVGKVDPEGWLTSDLPTDELKKEIMKIKGVGNYAAENLLKLIGRYDGLALDSWLRAQFIKKHNREKPCSDKKIEKHYKRFGEWRGLAIWFDMTERFLR